MSDPPPPELLPAGLDLAALLAPIPGDLPQGPDLREDLSGVSALARVRDAIAVARPAERDADAEGTGHEGVLPLWRRVAELATEALARDSKDLEIAAGLTEALLRLHGLRGLLAGAEVIRSLVDAYWEGLYPLPDAEGVVSRLAPINGLSGVGRDGTLMQPMRRLVLFNRPDGSPFSWWNYEQSRDLAAVTDEARRAQRIASGVVPYEEVQALAKGAGPALRRLRAEAAAARASWNRMAQDIRDRVRPEPGASTKRVADLLELMEEAATNLGPPLEEAGRTALPPEAAAASVTVGPNLPAQPPAGGDRDAMLRQLSAIAEFFHRMEPTSPLAYTLDDAVRRARMTWPDLLAEVVADERARSEILMALGIRPPQPGGDTGS